MQNITILVLDGDQRSALASTRALGRAGFQVITASPSKKTIADASCFSKRSFHYPNPSQDAAKAVEAISRITLENQVDLVMPMSDITTHMLLHAQRLQARLPYLACTPLRQYEHASDKARLVKTAQQLSVLTPITELIPTGTALTQLPSGFSYPVVLKPTRSRIATKNRYISTIVRVAKSPEEFVRIQKTDRWFTNAPWLLQSYVEGTGQGVFSIYDSGRPVAWFAHQRIREKPPSGGVSVLSKSVPLSEPLKTAAKTLLDGLEWHGPAMVEFRVTADGTPFLMEINARFWGSLQLAISAGINFPVLAAQIAMGEHPSEVTGYKTGIYNRWLMGDLDSLYLTLKAPQSEYSLWRKTEAVSCFLVPWWPGLHYEINQQGDMGPFWHELRHYNE